MVDTVIQAQKRLLRERSENSDVEEGRGGFVFDFSMKPRWTFGSGPLDQPADPGSKRSTTSLRGIQEVDSQPSKEMGPGDCVAAFNSADEQWYNATIISKVGTDRYCLEWEDKEYGKAEKHDEEIRFFAKEGNQQLKAKLLPGDSDLDLGSPSTNGTGSRPTFDGASIELQEKMKSVASQWKDVEASWIQRDATTTREDPQATSNAWEAAHARLELLPAIRVSGFYGERQDLINGFYLLINGPTDEAPVFQKAGSAGFWCYYATDNTWRVGSTSDMLERKDPHGDRASIRSTLCKPGLLPDEVSYWENPIGRSEDWERLPRKFNLVALTMAAYRSALPDAWAPDLWRAASIQLQKTPCLRVSGANGEWAEEVNGRYEALPGPQDQPPEYRKVESDLWGIYNLRDGTWRFGITEQEKEDSKMSIFRRCNWRHRTRGRAASKVTKPGTLPFDSTDWTLVRDTVCCDACRVWRRAPMPFSVKEVTLGEHEGYVGQSFTDESTTPRGNESPGAEWVSFSHDVGRVGSHNVGPQIRSNMTEPAEKKKRREMGLESGEKATIDLKTYAAGFMPTKSVDAYLREECLQIRKFATTIGPYMNEFINAAVEVVGDKVRNHNVLQKYPGLTPENILAIVVFTLELQSFCFAATDDDEFYRLYNFVLRQRKPGNLQLLAGYSHYLFTGLAKLPGYEGVLWRGIRDADAVNMALKNYKPRLKSIQWSAFSSASPDREVARQFATKEGLLFRMEVSSIARDIREVSAMPAESERLILPSSTFMVDKVAHRAEDGVWEVHLVEPPGVEQFTF